MTRALPSVVALVVICILILIAREAMGAEVRTTVYGGVAVSESYSADRVTIDTADGYSVSLVADLTLPIKNVRLQIEGTHTQNDIERVRFRKHAFIPEQFGTDINLNTVGGYVNLLYEREVAQGFSLFGGGGVGGLQVCGEISTAFYDLGYCDTDPSYQAIGGLSYNLSDRILARARFVYRRADGIDIVGFGPYRTKLVQAGLSYVW